MTKPFNALTDIDPGVVYSSDERIERVMGLRRTDVVAIDMPCEIGYRCPKCVYELMVDGNYDERLDWSEYNGFIWCAVCNTDYPSALCHPVEPGPLRDGAVDVFLSTVEQAINRKLRGN